MDSLLEPITETEKQLFCTTMMKRLDIQRRNEQFCDVILEVGSGDDHARLKAHRIVLSSAGPFFFNALKTDMKEKQEGVIRMKDSSKAVMEKVLDYLYTGHVDINEENAYELFAQADYLLMPGLKALSSRFILQTMDINNCIMSYYFAIKYQGEELQNGAKEFIHANFISVSGTEEFLNLSIEEIEEWISSDKIIIKEEEEVFQVIVKWMEKNKNSDIHVFLQLLHHVRCIYVSRSYVFEVMLQHPFVKACTACTELLLNAVKEVSYGSDECFFSHPPRDCLRTHEDAIVACGGRKTLCYVPSQNKWYELAERLSARSSRKFAVSSFHSKLFIIGGYLREPYGDIVECYDPSLDLWSPAKAPENVLHFTAAVTLNGILYIVGGVGIYNECLSTVQKYNPDTNQWQQLSPLSSPRASVCAVADGSYLYVIGGTSPSSQYLDIVERYDPRKQTWDQLPSTLAKRSGASGTAIRQNIFVIGGLDPNLTTGEPCEVFDPDTNTWSSIHYPSTVKPKFFASVVSFKGQIFIGSLIQTEHSPRGQEMILYVYDIDKNTWESCSTLGDRFLKICTLRISKDVLAKCIYYYW